MKNREITEGNPRPEDILLVAEVSDSSIEEDTVTKLAIYARAGIQEYWVLDINQRALRMYRDPVAATDAAGQSRYSYQAEQTFGEGEEVAPLARPDSFVHVAQLLLPAKGPAAE